MAAKTKKATKKATTKAAKKEGGVCIFSGVPTSSKRSRFAPGNDAKLKSVLLKVARGEAKVSDIPATAAAVLRKETLWGFSLSGSTLTAPAGVTAKPKRAKKEKAEKTKKEPKATTKQKARERVAANAKAQPAASVGVSEEF